MLAPARLSQVYFGHTVAEKRKPALLDSLNQVRRGGMRRVAPPCRRLLGRLASCFPGKAAQPW